MTRTRTLVVILLALLISTAGLVSVFGQTQDKPKAQTIEVKKAQCTDCRDCKGTCTNCKGNGTDCKDCKANCTDCKASCKDGKGHEKSCNGQCTNGHDKKAGPSAKRPDKK